ncbi:hypothetical protein KEM56_007711 [Ascosphaera pollenicola]|nr:hypothetical protein KEM56_007711 [Ascosphaera pollenicola]
MPLALARRTGGIEIHSLIDELDQDLIVSWQTLFKLALSRDYGWSCYALFALQQQQAIIRGLPGLAEQDGGRRCAPDRENGSGSGVENRTDLTEHGRDRADPATKTRTRDRPPGFGSIEEDRKNAGQHSCSKNSWGGSANGVSKTLNDTDGAQGGLTGLAEVGREGETTVKPYTKPAHGTVSWDGSGGPTAAARKGEHQVRVVVKAGAATREVKELRLARVKAESVDVGPREKKAQVVMKLAKTVACALGAHEESQVVSAANGGERGGQGTVDVVAKGAAGAKVKDPVDQGERPALFKKTPAQTARKDSVKRTLDIQGEKTACLLCRPGVLKVMSEGGREVNRRASWEGAALLRAHHVVLKGERCKSTSDNAFKAFT